ncbi:MAG: EAL domain-containing protein [Myxococcales bacterium]|nr:EAL domain-containing protein [Myxococcales bacterium]MCB9731395.1 EAL domain-containing protein [Deltaproteobacteria bacterium]
MASRLPLEPAAAPPLVDAPAFEAGRRPLDEVLIDIPDPAPGELAAESAAVSAALASLDEEEAPSEAGVAPPKERVPRVPAALFAVVGAGVAGGASWLLAENAGAAVVAGAAGLLAGGLGYIVGYLARRALAEETTLRSLLGRGTSDSLWTWVPARDEVWFSPRWQGLFGIRPGATTDLSRWLERVHPADRGRLQQGLDALASGTSRELRVVHRLTVANDFRWVDAHAVATEGAKGATVIAGSLHDITDRRKAEARLAHNAFHDNLTGLPNRAFFVDRLGHAVARARRNPRYRFAVLFIDVDGFKVVNDSLGHTSGDELLAIVAMRLKACVRPSDTVARIGGDEFTVLLDPVDGEEHTQAVAERLAASVHGSFEVRGHTIQTSISIGIAMSDRRYTDAQEILRDADTAMYRAKKSGKGGLRVFDIAMHKSAMHRIKIESELVRALERGTLTAYYQPIVRLDTRRIEGFEALCRVPREGGGMLPPVEFIPVAEETGLIDDILLRMLALACAQTAQWREQHPDLYVSVNVSGRSVRPALVGEVALALERHGLSPKGLKLELTESVLVDTASAGAEVVHGLADLGVGLYIDDFGTGYSSLSYMHKFSIECLKIDRSFVSALDGHRMPSIVETIIDLSNRVNARVIAEGIETEPQLEALRALRCTHGQGFRFSPAVPADAAGKLLALGDDLPWR